MTARAKASLLVIVLLGISLLVLRHAGNIAYDPQAGIAEELPAKAGQWSGDVLRYCTNRACGKTWMQSQLGGGAPCPACGSGLSSMAQIERELLPGDTKVERAEYSASGASTLVATLVFSGRDRSSIHRPEVCLSGSGSTITGSRDIEIPLAGRAPLQMTMLTLRQDYTAADGTRRVRSSFFAYWFVSRNRETASHTKRMALMASDQIFHGVTRRWAYVSIAGPLASPSADPTNELRAFLAAFVPQLVPH